MAISVQVQLELIGETDDLYLYGTHDGTNPVEGVSLRKDNMLWDEAPPTIEVIVGRYQGDRPPRR